MSNDHIRRALDKQSRELAGPSQIEQHIILLKLTELFENSPDFSLKSISGKSPQRQWIAEVGALVGRTDTQKIVTFNTFKASLENYWEYSINQIQGLVLDLIEELKLDLEISGRADVGSAYSPGEAYKFFSDLKSLLNDAQAEIFLIDPYFDGEAFDSYFGQSLKNVKVRIFANKNAKEVQTYIEKHKLEFSSDFEVRKNKKLHDRLIIIDNEDCWISGGSIDHGGQKSPSYLIPIGTELTREKLTIYNDIWEVSNSPT